MRFGSVCSGIEAASVAWGPLGWHAAWLAEIEPFPSAVLAHHYPDVPNLGDMTVLPERIARGEIEAPDVFCGGTPCQAFSVAGLRKSLDDARGNLSLVFCEIADAIDAARAGRGEPAAIIFWENVPGVLSTADNAFGCFLAGLAGESDPLVAPGGKWSNAGYVLGPQRAVAWRVLDAQYFGVAQRRRRVFVVASARDDFDPAQVLFEFDGVRRDTAPSREARQTAPTIPSRSTAGGGLGTDFDCDGGVITMAHGQGGAEIGFDRGPCLTCNHEASIAAIPSTTHTLRGEGFDASEDGTGRGTPLVPVGVTIHGTDPTVQKVASIDPLAQCLRARTPGNIDNSSTTVVMQPVAMAFAENTRAEVRLEGGDGSRTGALSTGGGKPGQGVPCVAVSYGIRTANTSSNGWGIQEEVTHTLDCAQGVAVAVALRGRDGGATAELGDEVSHCLRASSGGGDKPHVLAPSMGAKNPTAVAVGTDTYNGSITGDVAATLGTKSGDGLSSGPSVMQAMQVRRLTPTECERLQGFPDGYTAIPWRGKPADQCPDGPRYKALGNSWAVPNVRWIGARIAAHLNPNYDLFA